MNPFDFNVKSASESSQPAICCSTMDWVGSKIGSTTMRPVSGETVMPTFNRAICDAAAICDNSPETASGLTVIDSKTGRVKAAPGRPPSADLAANRH
jgi:hypothetical protein